MKKEKRIEHLIQEMKNQNRTITVKTVVVASILSDGIKLSTSDEKEIQTIINKYNRNETRTI